MPSRLTRCVCDNWGVAVMHVGNRTSANRTDDQKQCAMFWMGNIEAYCLELTRMVSTPFDALGSGGRGKGGRGGGGRPVCTY